MSFADDIVLYIENPKYPTRKMWEIKNKFTKVTGYKINIQKAVTLLYINNELSETELRKQSFTIQFSWDTQLRLTLCDPMDHKTPDFPVHHQQPELTQTHVHWVCVAI